MLVFYELSSRLVYSRVFSSYCRHFSILDSYKQPDATVALLCHFYKSSFLMNRYLAAHTYESYTSTSLRCTRANRLDVSNEMPELCLDWLSGDTRSNFCESLIASCLDWPAPFFFFITCHKGHRSLFFRFVQSKAGLFIKHMLCTEEGSWCWGWNLNHRAIVENSAIQKRGRIK